MNYPTTLVTSLLVSGLLTFAVSVFAGEEGASGEVEKPGFDTVDTNSDGVITQNEAENTWLSDTFSTVDDNGDGMVSRSEYDAASIS